ncbi:hypothetical protein BG011_006853 [Mortierella polycephala]|uniref:Uncharacterized protein n=1 Tax=Mortierella polycephala TaxID=41804 RepID=A0A9P6PTQ6_9FUNG|nr:hypothetical protein BG011_006853 [Mortierella polycephala]
MAIALQLPLEIWFQILNQALNLLLPTATTPRLYSANILPLLLISHTFHEHCHPVTYPHLRKHKLLQLFSRWKAAHSREVHFYHHPLRTHVRYALPDRVGNPPGEEYETLYSFIKRSYLFGCESVCGTVIPVEGGLEGPAPTVQPQPLQPQPQQQLPENAGAPENAAANMASIPPLATTGSAPAVGNVVIAPPPAPVIVPMVAHHGVDGGGQGWKGHALQWHVANPTFAAEGTIELYGGVVEEYRRVVCGRVAARERTREIERALSKLRNPERYATAKAPAGVSEMSAGSWGQTEQQQQLESGVGQSDQIQEITEEDGFEEDEKDEREEEDDEEVYDEENADEDESYIVDEDQEDGHEIMVQDGDELLSEIEAKGGLRRRDSGHGQSSSEMDVDDDGYEDQMDDEDDGMMNADQDTQGQEQEQGQASQRHIVCNDADQVRRGSKREPEMAAMDCQLDGTQRHRRDRRGPHNRKMERSSSVSEQERLIMDMAMDKPYHAMQSLLPFHPLGAESAPLLSSSTSCSTSAEMNPVPSAPFNPLTRRSREAGSHNRSKSTRRSLQRSRSSPDASTVAQLSSESHDADSPDTSCSSSSSSSSTSSTAGMDTRAMNSPTSSSLSSSSSQHEEALSSATPDFCQQQPLTRPLRAEDLDFDLASACANTFASDLAFVLARVPGLGAHFHRFEQLAKLKLHVGWARHAQSRGGNDVFVMSCSRLIGILAPLANTPLVSERGG